MKKLLAFILGTALILGAVFCCVGCGEDNSTQTQEEQEKGGSEKEDKKDKCADGHTWGEWAQKTAATCVAAYGVNVRTCPVCGKTEEQTAQKTGIHSFSGGVCTVCQAEPVPTETLEFGINDVAKTAIVIRIHDTDDGHIVIPSTYKGKKVVSIGKYAFSTCENIKSITIPHTVKSVNPNESEFVNVSSSIEHFYVDAKNETFTAIGDCLIDKKTKTLVLGSKNSKIPNDGSVTSIGEYAFIGNKAISKIEIPSSVKTINKYAFGKCSSLAEIVMSEGLETIEAHAFDSCTALASLTLPKGFISMGANAFQKCSAIKNVFIPKSTEKITVNAFGGCSAIESGVFEDPSGWTRNGKAVDVSSAALGASILKGSTNQDLIKNK